jgi:hypothetical protein
VSKVSTNCTPVGGASVVLVEVEVDELVDVEVLVEVDDAVGVQAAKGTLDGRYV